MSQLSYCAEFIRTHDRNRYLCALSAPAVAREAWFALFAFHHEISTIADKVGEEMVGFVRYAWWRETLTTIYAGKPPRGHPLAEALAPIVAAHALSKQHFDAIIDAHEKALAEKMPVDEEFLQATAGQVMVLCGHVLSTVVIPAKAGISLATHYPVATEIPAFAGMTTDSLIALGVALAAVEAASLPTMDEEHRRHFCDLAARRLGQAEPVSAEFSGFAHITRFYLQRLAKGRVPTASDRAFWLPFYLWRQAA